MRDRLVAAAVRVLGEQGPAALQARRLAREVDASTMAVYHYFGGMPQLLAAVIDEGFRRLDARLVEVPRTDDPVADLSSLALAYRAAARANPHLYDLMFGLSAPGGHRPDGGEDSHPPEGGGEARPPEGGGEARSPDGGEDSEPGESDVAQRAYGRLVQAADLAVRAGRISDGDPAHVAAQLWSFVHGYVTLELAGHFDRLDGPARVFKPMGISLLIGLGDDPGRAAGSVERALAGLGG